MGEAKKTSTVASTSKMRRRLVGARPWLGLPKPSQYGGRHSSWRWTGGGHRAQYGGAHAAGSSTASARSAWRRFMDSLDTKANLQADRRRTAPFQAGHPGQKGPKPQTTPTCTYHTLLVDTCIATCAVPTLGLALTAKKLDTSQPRVLGYLVDGCRTNHSFCITPPRSCALMTPARVYERWIS